MDQLVLEAKVKIIWKKWEHHTAAKKKDNRFLRNLLRHQGHFMASVAPANAKDVINIVAINKLFKISSFCWYKLMIKHILFVYLVVGNDNIMIMPCWNKLGCHWNHKKVCCWISFLIYIFHFYDFSIAQIYLFATKKNCFKCLEKIIGKNLLQIWEYCIFISGGTQSMLPCGHRQQFTPLTVAENFKPFFIAEYGTPPFPSLLNLAEFCIIYSEETKT